MSDVKISVIVPVYNSANYLDLCLESLIHQSLKEIEIICVNDGSTDNSLEILNKYSKVDRRVLVVNQNNQGAACARNNGLQMSKGKYVIFLDSDDFFSEFLCEKFYNSATMLNTDICICHSMLFYNDKNKTVVNDSGIIDDLLPDKEVFNYQDIPNHIIGFCQGYAWDKLYNREFLITNNLLFQNIPSSEDMCFVFLSIVLAKRISVIPDPLVTYRVNEDNSISTSRDKNPLCFIEAILELQHKLIEKSFYPIVERSFINWIVPFCFWHLNTLKKQENINLIRKVLINDLFPKLNIPFFSKGFWFSDHLYYYLHWFLEHSFDVSNEVNMNLKIMICFHKPAKLIDGNIFLPIHSGRVLLKDKIEGKFLSQSDANWLLENTIGDDTGDNISEKSDLFNELTAVYWAWKNYKNEKLKNPDYIGLMHYRRHFAIDDSNYFSVIGDNEIIAGQGTTNFESMLSEFESNHDRRFLDDAMNHVKDYSQDIYDVAEEYLNQKTGAYFNMFIMKRELFFEYCVFLFGILDKVFQTIDYTRLSAYQSRIIGFLAERLTGIFFYYKQKNGCRVKYENVHFVDNTEIFPTLYPVVRSGFDDTVNIAMATNDLYCMHLETAIISFMENSSNKTLYCVYVMYTELSVNNKKSLEYLSNTYHNLELIFIPMSNYVGYFGNDSFDQHMTIETYFRFFIPEIFANFKKIVWIDCDVIATRDIYDLYSIDLQKNWVAACVDIEMARMCAAEDFSSYLTETLHIKKYDNYFQAGVVIFNIDECKKNKLTKLLLDAHRDIENPRYLDQDILNVVCQDHVLFLDPRWNFEWHVEFQTDNITKYLSVEMYKKMNLAKNDPFIVHYCSMFKPWKDITLPYAFLYWRYAIKSPLFASYHSQNYVNDIKNEVQKERLDIGEIIPKYIKYYIINVMSFGLIGKWKHKYKDLKEKLRS